MKIQGFNLSSFCEETIRHLHRNFMKCIYLGFTFDPVLGFLDPESCEKTQV